MIFTFQRFQDFVKGFKIKEKYHLSRNRFFWLRICLRDKTENRNIYVFLVLKKHRVQIIQISYILISTHLNKVNTKSKNRLLPRDALSFLSFLSFNILEKKFILSASLSYFREKDSLPYYFSTVALLPFLTEKAICLKCSLVG